MDQGRQVFSVDLLERYASKNRGMITCMAAGNDVIVLGTSKGWIIRHDFGVGSSYDIDLSVGRTGEQSIHKVFVDPGGSHCIATVTGVGGAETFYTHAKWPKPRVLSRLKGLLVNSVAWNRQQITEVSTKEIILGTQDGQLFEMAVDEKDKREKYIKFLFELEELPEAFMALQMETANINSGMRYYVMAVTPTRLYSFTGIGTLEKVWRVDGRGSANGRLKGAHNNFERRPWLRQEYLTPQPCTAMAPDKGTFLMICEQPVKSHFKGVKLLHFQSLGERLLGQLAIISELEKELLVSIKVCPDSITMSTPYLNLPAIYVCYC
ncbi:hypothetical protein Bca52824_062605 [Brassica carinata]|uniref:Pep3/Vps18 beta-propeller domain-containing protein n=1 Tax=Brassica carinata TaxID=52824 RepID=A0A8X7U6H0_BRACI|nr:hypothetical protein Bca52824_062605 [Brassica carinata]